MKNSFLRKGSSGELILICNDFWNCGRGGWFSHIAYSIIIGSSRDYSQAH
jgi:hypothetical protein